MSNANHDALLRRAKQIVDAELRSYDLLSRPAKIRRTHEHEQPSVDVLRDSDIPGNKLYQGPSKGYVCGHNISLCSPCDKCTRSAEDCIEYQVAFVNRLKVLLSQLGKA